MRDIIDENNLNEEKNPAVITKNKLAISVLYLVIMLFGGWLYCEYMNPLTYFESLKNAGNSNYYIFQNFSSCLLNSTSNIVGTFIGAFIVETIRYF